MLLGQGVYWRGCLGEMNSVEKGASATFLLMFKGGKGIDWHEPNGT